MNFFKKLFSKKDNAEKVSSPNFSEGDIFYTIQKNHYNLYKLLKIDDDFDTYHVLSYSRLDKLPTIENIGSIEVQIWHCPIARDGFKNAVLLTKSAVTEQDLIGYHEYLRITGQDEYAIKANALYSEAYRLTDEGKHEDAISKYSEAIELMPNFFEAIDNRAFCKMDMGKWQDAIEDFLLSLSVNPDSFLAEFSIGECYLRLKEYKKAKEQFEKALIIEPTNEIAKEYLIKASDLDTNS